MDSDLSLPLSPPIGRREREPELLGRAKHGDHDAYARLVRPYEHAAYRVAAAITGHKADAEEAMQNGFLKAYRALDRFRAGAAFKPWLLRIVVNEAHNVVRDRRRHVRLESRAAEQHEMPAGGADEALITQEDSELVLGALARLSEPDRVVLALRYFAELPDDQAAALVGTSAPAYRVRLMRARRRLEHELDAADG
jgi:RNA polymerase sigma factor (sigma-70 family)